MRVRAGPMALQALRLLKRAKQRVKNKKQPKRRRQAPLQGPLPLAQLSLPAGHVESKSVQLSYGQVPLPKVQWRVAPRVGPPVEHVRGVRPWPVADHPAPLVRSLGHP